MDLWTFADILSLKGNKYINGGGNIIGALYHIDNMYKSGVRIIILMPRFDYGEGALNALRLERADELCRTARSAYPGLSVCVGSRIRYYSGLTAALQSGRARSIGGGRYILIEFERDASFGFMLEAVKECFDAGYRPLIENPLYYDEADTDIIEGMVENGAYTVWDKAVFEGRLHRSAKKHLDTLFAKKLVHFVSDGADGAAVTDYTAAASNAAAMYGDDTARGIFYENYMQLISGGTNIIPS
ncbi:MAG: hypothetical protein NC223_08025 [Butyrivibrio sp.]|nr:hypothetical protein [Butyrivibrio sp.]